MADHSFASNQEAIQFLADQVSRLTWENRALRFYVLASQRIAEDGGAPEGIAERVRHVARRFSEGHPENDRRSFMNAIEEICGNPSHMAEVLNFPRP
ncbi:hypothetical protein [Pseudogemmobacter bohemicus]|uniref:hypothetical protein n=1 Tax=Pseudogemmobacter bohemicus TaxID=2250708 RepID=UPI0013002721|nr:hypothetical protein [Pseudogemmobacter bohemicus]